VAAVRVSPEATVAMSTHTSITTSVEDNTACTNDSFSNQYSQQHSATPYHACIATTMQGLQHAFVRRLGSANIHLKGSLRFRQNVRLRQKVRSRKDAMMSVCCPEKLQSFLEYQVFQAFTGC